MDRIKWTKKTPMFLLLEKHLSSKKNSGKG